MAYGMNGRFPSGDRSAPIQLACSDLRSFRTARPCHHACLRCAAHRNVDRSTPVGREGYDSFYFAKFNTRHRSRLWSLASWWAEMTAYCTAGPSLSSTRTKGAAKPHIWRSPAVRSEKSLGRSSHLGKLRSYQGTHPYLIFRNYAIKKGELLSSLQCGCGMIIMLPFLRLNKTGNLPQARQIQCVFVPDWARAGDSLPTLSAVSATARFPHPKYRFLSNPHMHGKPGTSIGRKPLQSRTSQDSGRSTGNAGSRRKLIEPQAGELESDFVRLF